MSVTEKKIKIKAPAAASNTIQRWLDKNDYHITAVDSLRYDTPIYVSNTFNVPVYFEYMMDIENNVLFITIYTGTPDKPEILEAQDITATNNFNQLIVALENGTDVDLEECFANAKETGDSDVIDIAGLKAQRTAAKLPHSAADSSDTECAGNGKLPVYEINGEQISPNEERKREICAIVSFSIGLIGTIMFVSRVAVLGALVVAASLTCGLFGLFSEKRKIAFAGVILSLVNVVFLFLDMFGIIT